MLSTFGEKVLFSTYLQNSFIKFSITSHAIISVKWAVAAVAITGLIYGPLAHLRELFGASYCHELLIQLNILYEWKEWKKMNILSLLLRILSSSGGTKKSLREPLTRSNS